MRDIEQQENALEELINELQVFLELSFQEGETPVQAWLSETVNKIESTCWTKKQCTEENCPAYQNESGRCWLIAGPMCGGETQGKFIQKYGFCTSCDVYQDVIGDNQVRRLKELVIALIYSLRLKQKELQEAISEVKILSGFLPICTSCKKIRDDQGDWYQIEAYIRENSEAEFSHGVCPDCAKKLYPDYVP